MEDCDGLTLLASEVSIMILIGGLLEFASAITTNSAVILYGLAVGTFYIC